MIITCESLCRFEGPVVSFLRSNVWRDLARSRDLSSRRVCWQVGGDRSRSQHYLTRVRDVSGTAGVTHSLSALCWGSLLLLGVLKIQVNWLVFQGRH